MQQVKSEAFFAGARVVNPRQLPVRMRPPRRKLANIVGRAWVLHRHALVRAASAMALLAIGLGVWQVREPIGLGMATLGELAQGQAAAAGFAIGEISITGQALTREQDVFDALGVQPYTSTVAFDVEAARLRIAELPSVEAVSVRKGLPGDIVVTITEKVPVARWRVDGVTFVVDAQGDQIGEDAGAYGDLPLVVGDGAADDALVMIRALQQYPVLQEGLVALSRIADRRWDMIYETGLRVQLPELGVAQALRKLDMYQTEYQLLDRDVTVIDLRVDSLVAVRPAEIEEEKETKKP
ncbi:MULTISPECIES: cell division protein FtsQ/DivIB [unclassified Devosia]|uniref:cell division protein FtsQ/DivIB n=1 Tax=unclassified Devosia TaxID=196773 RepID=UPI001553420E|nr:MULTISPECIES: cell division protein FtsQ/DivIB [unclassified Devosia]